MSRVKESYRIVQDKSSSRTVGKQAELAQQRRRIEQSDRRKPILLRQLENQLKHLDKIDEDQDLQKCEDPCLNDQALQRLKMIAKEAKKLQILEIEKLSRLAIGKRILNLQLKKKKDEHIAKLKKKEKIQLFFRDNRIKRYDYETLIEDKLAKHTLIVRPYQNGKGFLQSDKLYQSRYSKALGQCRYVQTLKEVNRMFYQNYSGRIKSNCCVDAIFKFIWMPIVLFVIMGLIYPFLSFPYEKFLLLALLGVIVILLATAAVITFLEKPSQNNQIQQTIEDVRDYFESVNQTLALQGKNIEWVCPDGFMYLEVIFQDGLAS